MNKKEKIAIGVGFVGVVSLLIATVLLLLSIKPNEKVERLASIGDGQAGYGTTTTPGFKNNTLLFSGTGILESFIITGVGTLSGNIELYDATTTVLGVGADSAKTNSRAPSMSTSTITVLSIPNTALAGTYVFDRVINYGLIYSINPTGAVNVVGNGHATSSITFKP